MMRQAGRYLPEYREIRKRHTFLEMCNTPQLAAEVTLQPLRRFDFDAGIIFSDILIFLPAMGLEIDFPEGGPRLANPVGSAADVAKLRSLDAEAAIPQVYEAIRICVRELDAKTPLLGFCGAPFTLACYAIVGRGSKDWSAAKAFLYREPEAGKQLLDKLADANIAHLGAQIDAGAAAVQIFDSWAGVLSRDDFDAFSKPYLSRIVSAVRTKGVPVLVFARGVPPEWLDGIGADIYNLDWRSDLPAAYKVLQPAGVQGNLDPALLLGPRERAMAQARAIAESMADADRYVFNLGHGVLPQTDPDTVAAVIDAVHEVNR
jgi:uroporphyrinogen decarboxylase